MDKISALIKFYIVMGEEKKENKYNEHVNYISVQKSSGYEVNRM